MLLQDVRTPLQEEGKKEYLEKSHIGKGKQKSKKVANLTLDQQIKGFARIIVNQLLTESGLDEKE